MWTKPIAYRVACWVLRIDRNNVGEGDDDLTILEVVSAVHLRAVLGLQDGVDVTVEIDG